MQSEQLANLFKCMTTDVRIRIIQHLIQASGPIASRVIAESLGIDGAVCSQHLMRLTEIALITRRKSGRYAFYEVNSEVIAKIGEFFDNGVINNDNSK